eukprot:7385326-Prymnesium_polylepis.1
MLNSTHRTQSSASESSSARSDASSRGAAPRSSRAYNRHTHPLGVSSTTGPPSSLPVLQCRSRPMASLPGALNGSRFPWSSYSGGSSGRMSWTLNCGRSAVQGLASAAACASRRRGILGGRTLYLSRTIHCCVHWPVTLSRKSK